MATKLCQLATQDGNAAIEIGVINGAMHCRLKVPGRIGKWESSTDDLEWPDRAYKDELEYRMLDHPDLDLTYVIG